MQIKDNIEFHNVAELVPGPRADGLALYRYHREVISHLTPLGRLAAACSDGVELRFAGATHWINLTLSARSCYPWASGANVEVFRGDMPVASAMIPDGATQTLRLAAPVELAQLGPRAFANGQFGRELWRVFVSGATVSYHGIETAGQPIRPPRSDEKPRLRWLAYGSSITNTTPGYVHHAARVLGADVFNKGLCGACCCEKEIGGFLAQGEDWEFATLELGVNMRGSFSNEDFEERARFLVAELRRAAPSKPVILLTVFPTGDDYLATPTRLTEVNRDFRAILRRLQESARDPHLHLIEGDRILSCFGGLSADLVHPSAYGHQLMGHNLAALLKGLSENLA